MLNIMGMLRIKLNLLIPPTICVSFFVLTLSMLFCSSGSHSMPEKEAEDLQKLFQFRKEDEWKSAWHMEKHVRCRDQLLTHMDWACQKDIYRLDKKPKGVDDDQGFFIRKSLANSVIKPWSGFIRRKRENKSITDECCSPAGCTWEEYAEYCPAHRRMRVSRSHRS